MFRVTRGSLQVLQTGERLLSPGEVRVDALDFGDGPHALDVKLTQLEGGGSHHVTRWREDRRHGERIACASVETVAAVGERRSNAAQRDERSEPCSDAGWLRPAGAYRRGCDIVGGGMRRNFRALEH